MKTRFEQHIKNSLENLDGGYNPAHWSAMEARLNNAKSGKASSAGKAIGIAAGIIAVAGLVYFFSTQNSGENQTDKTLAQKETTTPANTVQHSSEGNTPVKEDNGSIAPASGTNSASNNNGANKKTDAGTDTPEQKDNSEEKAPTPVVHPAVAENKQPVSEQPAPVDNSLPLASFRLNQNLVCAGTEVQFTADKSNMPVMYRWDFGDGKTSAEVSPKHVYAKAGKYMVKLKATSKTDSKVAEQKNEILVNAVPWAAIDYSAPEEENPSEIHFESTADNGSTLAWAFGDNQRSSEKNPVHSYSKKGSYDVTLTSTNSSGCSTTATRVVEVKEFNLYAPNSFSPNADGHNDSWIPKALMGDNYVFTLSVFDITGKLIYKTSDKDSPWDGSNAKVGEVFNWKAAAKDKRTGKESNYTGTITIID